jgi:C-terminal processing protease CtpA/Prc
MARAADGTPILDLRGTTAFGPGVRQLLEKEAAAIRAAGKLVIDLRGTAASTFPATQTFSGIQEMLVPEPTTLPADRHVAHSGYRAQAGGASFYSSQQVTDAAARITPRNGLNLQRIVFVVDREAVVPPVALGLRVSKRAAILAHGEAPHTPVATTRVPLEGDWSAIVRVNDLVVPEGRVELRADAVAPSSDTDETLYARAAALLTADQAPITVTDPSPVWQPEATYATPAYPSEAHRLLAAYRLWGVMDAFFPYKHLLDDPWEGVLERFVPQVLGAANELEYAQALARMAARTTDSHVNVVGSAALLRWLGQYPAPVLLQVVEGKPVVIRITDATAAAGVAVGDEIVAVDGEEVSARAVRIAEHASFSTPAARDRAIAGRLLSGDDNSALKVTVRGADGRPREVTLPTGRRFGTREQRDGPVTRLLDHNIGYADLDRLEVADVPKMFEQFAGAAGIILDMRGYPRGTAWAIAPRINTRKPAAAALFYRPLLVAGSQRERLSFLQELPPTTTPVYDRPTVMLIDERAISQAEHTGLFFKAANGTTFIGSPTNGANGDVTTMVLPGNLRVSFTGHDVRWPDGRQLQRKGLQPDVEVRPTLAGIRAGRDEVLERAVDWLRQRTGSSSNIER